MNIHMQLREGTLVTALVCSVVGFLAMATQAHALSYSTTISNEELVQLHSTEVSDRFGQITGLGDLNGDGYDDFAVGAMLDSDNGVNSGAVYVVYGSEGVLSDSDINDVDSAVKITGESGDFAFGWFVTSGDLNDDGYDDLIVQEYQLSNFNSVYVVYGQEADFTDGSVLDAASSTAVIQGTSTFKKNENIFIEIGDTNGDGYDDIHWPFASNTGIGIIYGSSSVLTSEDVDGGTNSVSFLDLTGVNSVSDFSAGSDINGDGYDDIVFGAELEAYDGNADSGLIYIVHGKATQLPNESVSSPITLYVSTIGGESADDQFGSAVSLIGDVNGDGYDDIAAHTSTDGVGDEETLYILYGSPSGFATESVENGINTVAQLQYDTDIQPGYISRIDDLNDDGLDDFAVFNSRYDTDTIVDAGAIHVIYGQEAVYTQEPIADVTNSIRITGAVADDYVGWKPALYSADVDGNGYRELLISTDRNQQTGENGVAYILYASQPTVSVADNTSEYNLLECAVDTYEERGVSTTDDYDYSEVSYSTSGTVSTGSTGTYTVTYTSVNQLLIEAESVERTVTVQDTTDPNLSVTGDSSVSLTVGDSYTDAGATATDSCDGTLNEDIASSGTVDTSTVGTYTITYTVEDGAGNTDSATRTVSVVAAEEAEEDESTDDAEGDSGDEESGSDDSGDSEDTEEVDPDAPVNNISTGEGDGSSDTASTLGEAVSRERMTGGRVRVSYENGSSKVFQLFNINKKPKVQIHTNGDILIAITKRYMRTYDAHTGERIDQVKLFKKKQAHTKFQRYNVYKKKAGQNNIVVLGRYKEKQKKQVNMRTFVVKNRGKIARRNIQRIQLKNRTKFSKLNTSKNKKNGKKARIRLTRKGKVVQAYKYKITKKLGKSVLQ